MIKIEQYEDQPSYRVINHYGEWIVVSKHELLPLARRIIAQFGSKEHCENCKADLK